MGSGHSNVPRIVMSSSDDLNEQQPPSIEPETLAPTEIAVPSSEIMESSQDLSNIPDSVAATLYALTLSNEVVDLSSSGLVEMQSPRTEETIEAHPLLIERPAEIGRNETHGTVIMEDMDVDSHQPDLVDVIKDLSSSGGQGPENECGLDDQLVSIKPDMGCMPPPETVVDRPKCVTESDIIESNSGVSPVSSSSVSFNAKVDSAGPHDETGLNSEYDMATSMQKSILPEHSIASSGTTVNAAVDINARLDTRVEVRVYPCSNSAGNGANKKFTQFTIKPEGVIIQGNHRHRSNTHDIGAEYASFIGRKLQRYELSDSKACQLLVTTHGKNFWVVPAPEAFSRHSGTCRLLGDRKHPQAPHTLQVGDFLRVGSVGIVVIETHNGKENKILSEDKIQKIMKDTTNSSSGFLDFEDTDGENSEDSFSKVSKEGKEKVAIQGDVPLCYMCFDDENSEDNPLIAPCKCRGDTRYVHVNCLRKWHTAEADNQICFLSSVDATCSVCKSTFKSDLKLRDGRLVKLFKSSLEPPYICLLVATKHEMAQRLFNTRFQLSFSTLMKPDGMNASRPLLLGRSSMSDMVLDYRTVSARHARITLKNDEFIFTDAGSSNGSYLYLRRPVELTSAQPVQFRMGRSMISMKVVNKWNRRIFRAVRRSTSFGTQDETDRDDLSVGSDDGDVHVLDAKGNMVERRSQKTRESILESLPALGQLSQQSPGHFDLLQALAYPKRNMEKDFPTTSLRKRDSIVDETLNSSINNDIA